MLMPLRSTDRVRRILRSAGERDHCLEWDKATGRAVMFALLDDTGGIATKALLALGVDIGELRKSLTDSSCPTQSASDVIASARGEAKRRGHAHLGTEHLLLALMNHDNSVANSIASQGVDWTALNAKIETLSQEWQATRPTWLLLLQKMWRATSVLFRGGK
jgi:ATP-dependent Clp protease ATP-binding subunit ClpC